MRYVEMEKVEPGMVLGNDLFDMEGRPIIPCGSTLSAKHIQKLKNFGFFGIYIIDDLSKDIIIEKKEVKVDFAEGDSVIITDGPFRDYVCTVEKIDMDKQIVTVLVPMFNGDTPVELEFGQVDTL